MCVCTGAGGGGGDVVGRAYYQQSALTCLTKSEKKVVTADTLSQFITQ